METGWEVDISSNFAGLKKAHWVATRLHVHMRPCKKVKNALDFDNDGFTDVAVACTGNDALNLV